MVHTINSSFIWNMNDSHNRLPKGKLTIDICRNPFRLPESEDWLYVLVSRDGIRSDYDLLNFMGISE